MRRIPTVGHVRCPMSSRGWMNVIRTKGHKSARTHHRSRLQLNPTDRHCLSILRRALMDWRLCGHACQMWSRAYLVGIQARHSSSRTRSTSRSICMQELCRRLPSLMFLRVVTPAAWPTKNISPLPLLRPLLPIQHQNGLTQM